MNIHIFCNYRDGLYGNYISYLHCKLLGNCWLKILRWHTEESNFKYSNQHDYSTGARMKWGLVLTNLASILPILIVVLSFILIIIVLGSYADQWCNHILYILNSNVSITCWCWENRVVLSSCANIYFWSVYYLLIQYVFIHSNIYWVLAWFWFSYTCCAFDNIVISPKPPPITPPWQW